MKFLFSLSNIYFIWKVADMGRGRNRRSASRAVELDDDGETISSVSTVESSSSLEIDDDRGVVVVGADDMDDSLDLLYEKRSSSREHGLNGLIKAFASKVQIDFATNKGETILQRCVSIMKKGSAAEIALAAHALGLLALTVGESETAEIILKDSSSHLCRIAKQSLNADSRIAALESLAILTFVAGSGDEIASTLDVLWQVGSYSMAEYSENAPGITEPTPEVRSTALNSWAFLLSTTNKDCFDFSWLVGAFPFLLQLLEAENRSVRLAAGEGIVIIFEHLDCHNSDLDGSMSNAVVRTFISTNACEDVISKMRDLSIEAGGKGTSKKELNTQRNLFGDFLEYVEDGTGPDISLNLSRFDSLRISTWAQSIQVNMFRNFLGGGFQAHMLGNSFLHDVFDFQPKQLKKQVLSTTEKRMYFSPNSVLNKARTQELNRRRCNARTWNYGHYNIHMGEECS